MRLVLATLPEPLQWQLIDLQAGLQSEAWLRTALEGGFLDVQTDLKAVDSRAHMRALCNRWSARVTAMTSFIKHIEIEYTPAVLASDGLQGTQVCAQFSVQPEFRALFAQIAERVATGYTELISRVGYGDWAKLSSLKDARTEQCSVAGLAVARTMAAACILDLPSSVRTLGIACPLAHTVTQPLIDLGMEMNELRFEKKQKDASDPLEVTPYFIAFQLSRLECMDYLASCTMPGKAPPMGSHRTEHELNPLTLSSSYASVHAHIKPAYTPQALQQAVQTEMQHATRRDMLCRMAITAMARTSTWMQPYLSTLAESGVYDAEPAWALQTAIKEGHVDIVHHLKSRVTWEDMAKVGVNFSQPHGSPFYSAALSSRGSADRAFYENAIMAFLAHCEDEGTLENALVTFAAKDQDDMDFTVFEPVNSLMKKGFGRVLACYLDHGLDPNARAAANSHTLLEYADAVAPAMGHMIRAHEARRLSRALLSGIEADPIARPSKP